MYYEIVRFADDSVSESDRNCCFIIRKHIRNGDFEKVLFFLRMFDEGDANIDAAILGGRVYKEPVDDMRPDDRIVFEQDGYRVCFSDVLRDGSVGAFYLTAPLPEVVGNGLSV